MSGRILAAVRKLPPIWVEFDSPNSDAKSVAVVRCEASLNILLSTRHANSAIKPCVAGLENFRKEEVDNLVALGAIHFPR